MAQNLTDTDHPPASRFFDADQRIKQAGSGSHPPADTPTAAPALAPPVPYSTGSLTDVLLAALLADGTLGSLLGFNNNNGSATSVSTPASAPPPPPNPSGPPPSPVKRHSVSLDAFCDMYDIDASTRALLAEVGFLPGDPTELQPDEDLKQVGFSIYGWRRVHMVNLCFMTALADGSIPTGL
ncbi:hypothetical protein R3P38DRAFT_3193461 [Favolaschia claudopus]|uniref:Uncharacterized protein n=1 Tax=Favolaschia claudopus TaxID=2862362 RepID=A0AAW0BHS2_9AGAR